MSYGKDTTYVSNGPSPVDPQLIADAQQGDRDALNAILSEIYDYVYAIAWRMSSNDHDAADITQNALVAICNRISTFGGASKFTTWVYRIVTNAAIDEFRKSERRASPTDIEHHAHSESTEFSDNVVDHDELQSALNQLDPKLRIAVISHDVLGCSYDEIATMQAIPIGTVRSRISRGRSQLKNMLINGTFDSNTASKK